MKSAYQEYEDTLQLRIQSLLSAAESFTSRGTPIVVLKPRSLELLSVEPLNNPDALKKMLTDNPYSNIGVITGKENNLIAIKIERESEYEPDPKELMEELKEKFGPLPSTMTIQYPNDSLHMLYEYPLDEIKRSSLGPGVKVLRSNQYGSGLVLLQGSELQNCPVKELTHSARISQLPDTWVQHICSDPYSEVIFAEEKTVERQPVVHVMHQEDCPEEIDIEPSDTPSLQVFESTVANSETVNESEKSYKVTGEEYLQLVIAKMVIDGMHPSQAVEQAKAICHQRDLAFDPNELFMMVYAGYHNSERYSGATSDKESLMRFIADVELEVFRDHHRELCCKIKPKGDIVSLSTKAGSSIAMYLTYRILQLTNTTPKDSEVKTVMKIIETVGQFEGDQIKTYNRVAKYDNAIYYDLGTQNAVRVTGENWQLVDAPPIFRRYSNHKVQVTPKQGGRVEKFFNFVNHEEKDRLLLAVYIIASFIPEIAHPVLYVYGSHGGAKSSMSSKLKTVIDPGTLDKLILNNKKDEVVRNLKQHYVSHYDNISHLTNEISDVFCIASTGGGMDNRRKYTDEESHIMSFKHCVILNGIKLAIKKPDLLDRSILIKLKRVKAKDEIEINEGFQEALPEILGGVFDTLVKAMALYPTVEIEDLPRMASFAKWGYAIAEALGGYGSQFLQDYRNNIAEQNDLLAAGNSLAHAVLAFMENKPEVHTTIGKAYDELSRSVKTDRQDRTFPSRSKDLRPYLEELGPVLDSFGIRFEFGKVKTNIGWTVKFTNVNVSSDSKAS